MTSLRADPLYHAARAVLRRISPPASSIASTLGDLVQPVLDRYARVDRTWRLLRTAERCGWQAAAGRMRDDLTLDVRTLHQRVGDLMQWQERLQNPPDEKAGSVLRPSLRLVLDELRQLEQEFPHVEYRPRQ